MFKKVASWTLGVLAAGAIITDKAMEYAQIETLNVTIRAKPQASRVDTDAGFSYYDYPVVTDKGMFNDCRSLTMLKFDDGEIYSQMKVGETWNLKVDGVGLFGNHRTILSGQKVP